MNTEELIHKINREYSEEVKDYVKNLFGTFIERGLQRIDRLNNPVFYDWAPSTIQPLALNYKNRNHVYVWSNTTTTLTSIDYVVNVPAGTWTLLDFREGTRLFAPTQNTPLVFRCLDEILNTSIAVTQGGSASVGRTSRTVHTNNGTATSYTSPDLIVGDLTELAVDIVFTSFTGGTSPSIIYTINRKDAFNNYNVLYSTTAITSAGKDIISIGAGMGTGTLNASDHAVGVAFGDIIQISYITTGTPSSVTQSISIKGK